MVQNIGSVIIHSAHRDIRYRSEMDYLHCQGTGMNSISGHLGCKQFVSVHKNVYCCLGLLAGRSVEHMRISRLVPFSGSGTIYILYARWNACVAYLYSHAFYKPILLANDKIYLKLLDVHLSDLYRFCIGHYSLWLDCNNVRCLYQVYDQPMK